MLNVAVRSKGGALVVSVGDSEIHAELQVCLLYTSDAADE